MDIAEGMIQAWTSFNIRSMKRDLLSAFHPSFVIIKGSQLSSASSKDRHWCTPMIVVIVNEARFTQSLAICLRTRTLHTQVSKLIEANNLDIYTTSISIKAPTVTGLLNGLELHSPNL